MEILDYKEWKEIKESETTYTQEIASNIKDMFLELFPNSFVSAGTGALGKDSVLVKIALGKDKSEFSNGIIQNDPMHQVIHITGFNKDGSYNGGNLEVTNSSKGFMIKSSNPMYAYETVKVWRSFKGDDKKVIDSLKKYFLKLKEEIKLNLDKLPEYVKDKI